MTIVARSLERTLLPGRHLRWRSTVVALVAAAGPACAVTIWLAAQGGDLLPALAMTGLLLFAAAVLTWRVLASRVVLQPDGLQFSSPRRFDVRVSRGRVVKAVIRAVHASDGLRVTRHLFLLDNRGQTVFRMCDRWWTDEQIGRVARHFEVPLESLSEPVHLSELRRAVPHQLQWNEQHPFLARLAMVLGASAGCLAVGWLAASSL